MKRNTGFTIMELLAVMAIIVTIIAIGVPAYNSLRNRAKVAKARATIAILELALERYKSDNGDYPFAGDDLNNPANPVLENFLASHMNFKEEDMGTGDGDYDTSGNVLLDPWGYYYTVIVSNTYNLDSDGNATREDFAHNLSTCYIYSRGPDGARGDCNPDFDNPDDVDNDNVDNYRPM